MRLILVAIIGFFSCTGSAWAWGDQGHTIICEIAMRLAKPSTRAELRKLIKTDDEFDYFRDSCTWPDHPRQKAPRHFVNLPRDAEALKTEACPAAGECVLTGIKEDFAVLSSTTASQSEKLASLKLLGHWVGDIHQPLHVSFKDDKGGNDVLVSGECKYNLHSVWDTCLVVEAVGPDVLVAANNLIEAITPVMIEAWIHSDPVDWANESFEITKSVQAKYCSMQGTSCEAIAGKVRIDAGYISANGPIVKEQLQKAGVRLAHMLDAAFSK